MLPIFRAFIERQSPQGAEFWRLAAGNPQAVPLQDHADIVYCAFMLSDHDFLDPAAAGRFADYVAELPLYGKRPERNANNPLPPANAHLTAYLLGSLRLLEAMGKAAPPAALYQGWDRNLLFDSTGLPRWPALWSHHIWRVSHWIGGSVSILLHLARSGKVSWADDRVVGETLRACEARLLDRETGLLKPYRSRALQALFRRLYALRHDPGLSDLGGVVHLLWVYHALGRPYLGREALWNAVLRELLRRPFMETVPYCLDFDILQLARTAAGGSESGISRRAEEFTNDTLRFFSGDIPASYTLHKLPGALASLHECAFMLGEPTVRGLGVRRIDIIEQAFWL